MTITQTVDILADRRVHLDFELPPDFPVGKTILTFRPLTTATVSLNDEKVSLSEKEKARDIEIINQNAKELNIEAMDVLSYQELDL